MSKLRNTEYSLADYRAPNSEILFTLEHVADVDRLGNWNGQLAKEILLHASKFVEEVIAPAEPDLDTQLPIFENGRVKVAPALVQIAKQFSDDGWFGLSVPVQEGGQGQPVVLTNVIFEMIAGASLNTSMALLTPTSALKLILAEASTEQKSRYITGLLSGEYNATIVLSEPQAGSDLRLIRAMARPTEDGNWLIEGEKVFCSNADHDMSQNILHCVIARTEGAPDGVKGLSLFLCPAVLPDGSRNDISISRVEQKMGLHASPTCQMNFDGAVAEMVGAEGEGLHRMFTMMNAMRVDVAVQGVGLCQIALQRSMAYAADRKQGRGISIDHASPEPLTINKHGDIRRMLLTMDALTKGCRAMVYRTAIELELDQQSKLGELLIPVCKVFASDAANEVADMAIQIHGGYGYIGAYQIEQIARDARVSRIYEGTNGLHATNLARSLSRSSSQAVAAAFEQDIKSTISNAMPDTKIALTDTLDIWCQSRDKIAQMADPGMVAYDFMRMTGFLAFASVWGRLEKSAQYAPNPENICQLSVFVWEYMLPETGYLFERIKRCSTL